MKRFAWVPATAALVSVSRLPAQSWNDREVGQLIHRAILVRETPSTDTSLTTYRSRAHGFVFYLVQTGPGFPDPPRVAKADELNVEVYWRAPGTSKQRIVDWRDANYLPIQTGYHRDHLGIVTNNFGPLIRIGEGDEVRDAVHPLSIEGIPEYDYAITDTLELRTLRGELEVLAVQVRPRDMERSLVVGTLYLERQSAALVRFQFSFTPAAYRDQEVEDISVLLEQSLFEGKWWLPWHQEVEVRRRPAVVDFPIRSIIKGRWDIGEYEFGIPFPAELLVAPEFGGLTRPARDTGQWGAPLRAAAEAAEPFDRREFDELKTQAQELLALQVLEGIPRRRFGAPALSELARVNRVQGLAVGFALGYRFDGGWEARGAIGYGLSDRRVTASLGGGLTRGSSSWSLEARRAIRDTGDEPVVSGVINSFLAQEAGIDLGSYLLAEEIGVGYRHRFAPRWTLDLAGRFERTSSVETTARAIRNEFQPNPALGSGSYWLGRAALTLRSRGALDRSDLKATVGIEGGIGETEYLRLSFRSDGSVPVGFGHLRLRTVAGLATAGLPKSRSFTIGGRGTLPGEQFRGYGGRRAIAAQLEWRIPVPVPAVGLGPFATTGNRATLAPMFGIGWAGGAIEEVPWTSSEGARPIIGVAAELLHGLVRFEFARRLRGEDRRFRLTVDLSPEWWPIL
ncbi:MAG: hypothetical protein ACT4PM_09755 [Gemmatimonadales bacterium]